MIAVMFVLLIPGITLRITNEFENKNVIISLLYNDIYNKVSKEELDETLEKYKDLNLNTVSVMEEDINSLLSRGEVTCIKYNVLQHKYDTQSLEIIDYIKQNCEDITFDSQVLLVTKETTKANLAHWLPLRYTDVLDCPIEIFSTSYLSPTFKPTFFTCSLSYL